MPAFAQSAVTSEQTKNGTIIWHEPRTGQAAAKDKPSDSIIWNDAKGAPTQSPTSPSGTPDRNGIVWNDPPSAAKNQTAAAPAVSPPTPSPQTGADVCREFDADVTIEGQRQPMRGTACRQPDGRWRVVSQVPR